LTLSTARVFAASFALGCGLLAPRGLKLKARSD
jgi:hypothetical protein